MRTTRTMAAALCAVSLAVGCAAPETGPTGGSGGATTATGTGGTATGAGTGGATTSTGTGGAAPGTGTGGAAPGAGTGGATTGSASGGASGPASGSGGGSATGGRTNTGGAAGGAAGTGGASVTGGRGGATAGSGSGGAAGASGSGGAGTGTGIGVSASCQIPTWPSPVGSTVNISGTRQITGVYDGKMAVHEGTLEDCSANGQGSTDPVFDVADGGTIKNVIMGKKVGDGIHCQGSCTIDNVWFPYVCDDAVTMLGGSGKTATIQNSGFKNARDKTIQHNGDGSTVVLKNIYAEVAGKLYRSCGEGCSSSAKRTVMASDIIAIGVNQIIGVSTNDKATITNVCAYRSPTVCKTYQPGSDNETTVGANQTAEGPTANCVYQASDTHALVDRVSATFTTDVLCTGPNSAKEGSTATACVSGFDACIKGCAPGAYGMKQSNCVNGKYAASGSGCGLPKDAAIASKLAMSNMAMATTKVSQNGACTTQWAWGTDGADKFCVCVMKPGYYQESDGWFVWDCQTPWW